MNDLDRMIQERNAAFEADDIGWAAKMMPGASSPLAVEAAFHKARMQVLTVSAEKRRESINWLAEKGIKDALGQPVKHGDPLPE